jgi:hypothetical protein
MKRVITLVAVCLCWAGRAGSPARAEGPTQVGEVIPYNVASPALAPREAGTPAWTHRLTDPKAAYVAPHFATFNLPQGARLVVRSGDGSRSWDYEGTGKGELGLKEGFWGIHIDGDTAILEIFSTVPVAAGAVRLDGYARGYEFPGNDTEALCGADDSQWAKCYQTSHPTVYNKSRAVARLLINGTGLCTGWLVGSGGHLMTNEHCITSAGDALNTDYEFMAEGATCATSCASALGCPGTVVATSATLIQLDAPLDYALVKLPTNPVATYGFLQMRNTGTNAAERIYIPGHPQGWGKKIALHSTHANDTSGYCEIQSVTRPSCSGAAVDDIGYYCDTQGGSSGSPVLALCDNAVVSLHHCANCPNRGVPIDAVITDLGANVPPNSITTSSWSCGDCGPGFCLGNSYCDDWGCFPATSTISRAVCQCGLMNPSCGLGACVGDNYCDGPNCPGAVCWINTAPQSQIMCSGMHLNAFCNVVP